MDIRLRFKTSYIYVGFYTTEFKLPLLRSMHDFEFRNDFENDLSCTMGFIGHARSLIHRVAALPLVE